MCWSADAHPGLPAAACPLYCTLLPAPPPLCRVIALCFCVCALAKAALLLRQLSRVIMDMMAAPNVALVCTRCNEETGSHYECCGQVVCDECYEAEAFDRTTATDPICEECCLRLEPRQRSAYEDDADEDLEQQEQIEPNAKKQKPEFSASCVDAKIGQPSIRFVTGNDACGVCSNRCYALDSEVTTSKVIKSVSAGHVASTPQLVCPMSGCAFMICVDCAPAQYDLCDATSGFGVKRTLTPACHVCNANDLSGPIKCKDVLEK